MAAPYHIEEDYTVENIATSLNNPATSGEITSKKFNIMYDAFNTGHILPWTVVFISYNPITEQFVAGNYDSVNGWDNLTHMLFDKRLIKGVRLLRDGDIGASAASPTPNTFVVGNAGGKSKRRNKRTNKKTKRVRKSRRRRATR